MLFIFSKLKELTVIAFHLFTTVIVANSCKPMLFIFSKLKELAVIAANQGRLFIDTEIFDFGSERLSSAELDDDLNFFLLQ